MSIYLSNISRIHIIKMSNGKVKKWRKVLYDNAGFPDNYTPEEAFLAARRYNENLVTYSLGSCLSGGAEVATQLSLVIIFWSCYKFIKLGSVSPASLTLCVMSVSVLGYLIIIVTRSQNTLASLMAGLKTSFLFTVTGYSLSPVLHTLTDSISTDSLHTMAASSFVLHLLTSDYGLPAPVVSWQISINAAVFSSVCLASRFTDHLSAFSLMCVSVFCFLLLPLARSHILSSSLTWSLLTSLTSIVLLSSISMTHGLLAGLALLTLQILCPVLFYRLQSDKLTIHGPWDEATPGNN